MKTSLKTISLLLVAASFPCVAFAELAGGRIPVVITAENLISVFSIVSIAVIVGLDYTRGQRRRSVSLAPASSAQVRRESHRLAA